MIPSMSILSVAVSARLLRSGQKLYAITPPVVASWPDLVERLGWCRPRLLGQFGDFGNSLAQVDLDTDLVAHGHQLLLQQIGVGHWERPGLSVPRLECDRTLSLINSEDRARAEGGRGITGEDRRTHHAEQTECHYCDSPLLHGCTSKIVRTLIIYVRQKADRLALPWCEVTASEVCLQLFLPAKGLPNTQILTCIVPSKERKPAILLHSKNRDRAWDEVKRGHNGRVAFHGYSMRLTRGSEVWWDIVLSTDHPGFKGCDIRVVANFQ